MKQLKRKEKENTKQQCYLRLHLMLSFQSGKNKTGRQNKKNFCVSFLRKPEFVAGSFEIDTVAWLQILLYEMVQRDKVMTTVRPGKNSFLLYTRNVLLNYKTV
jgi:hypothetical protein